MFWKYLMAINCEYDSSPIRHTEHTITVSVSYYPTATSIVITISYIMFVCVCNALDSGISWQLADETVENTEIHQKLTETCHHHSAAIRYIERLRCQEENGCVIEQTERKRRQKPNPAKPLVHRFFVFMYLPARVINFQRIWFMRNNRFTFFPRNAMNVNIYLQKKRVYGWFANVGCKLQVMCNPSYVWRKRKWGRRRFCDEFIWCLFTIHILAFSCMPWIRNNFCFVDELPFVTAAYSIFIGFMFTSHQNCDRFIFPRLLQQHIRFQLIIDCW